MPSFLGGGRWTGYWPSGHVWLPVMRFALTKFLRPGVDTYFDFSRLVQSARGVSQLLHERHARYE